MCVRMASCVSVFSCLSCTQPLCSPSKDSDSVTARQLIPLTLVPGDETYYLMEIWRLGVGRVCGVIQTSGLDERQLRIMKTVVCSLCLSVVHNFAVLRRANYVKS